MEQHSNFGIEALRRFPGATICGVGGPYAVVLYDGRITLEMFPTLDAAKKFSGGGLQIVYLGPPTKAEPLRYNPADREDDERWERKFQIDGL